MTPIVLESKEQCISRWRSKTKPHSGQYPKAFREIFGYIIMVKIDQSTSHLHFPHNTHTHLLCMLLGYLLLDSMGGHKTRKHQKEWHQRSLRRRSFNRFPNHPPQTFPGIRCLLPTLPANAIGLPPTLNLPNKKSVHLQTEIC